jgi:membrane protease YdiL (CAAX protease family)
MVDNVQEQRVPPDTGVGWWEPVVAFVAGNALGLALMIVGGAAATLAAMALGWHIPDPAALTAGFSSSFAVNMIVLTITNLAMIVVMWWLVRRRRQDPLAAYFPPVAATQIWLAVAIGLVMAVVLNGLNEVLSQTNIVVFHDSDTERALLPHGAGQFLASVAVVSLIAPFAEECLFRGLLFRWLAGLRGQAFAVAVSAIVFGLLHGQFLLHPDAQGVLASTELIVAGAVLAVLVARTGSLRTSFATHAAYNLGATLFSVLVP